jgi:hypothetical protein
MADPIGAKMGPGSDYILPIPTRHLHAHRALQSFIILRRISKDREREEGLTWRRIARNNIGKHCQVIHWAIHWSVTIQDKNPLAHWGCRRRKVEAGHGPRTGIFHHAAQKAGGFRPLYGNNYRSRRKGFPPFQIHPPRSNPGHPHV